MKADWFENLVNTELKKRGWGGAKKLAEALGIDQSRITKWASGTEPGLYNAQAFLKEVGWDFAKAAPPTDDSVIGETRALYGKNDELDNILSESPWSKYADEAEPIRFLRVADDIMAPMYAKGCTLVLRKIKVPTNTLPTGAPCVFGSSVKLLIRLENNAIYWMAINSRERITKHSEATHIVLSAIQPQVTATIQFHAPIKTTRTASRKTAQ